MLLPSVFQEIVRFGSREQKQPMEEKDQGISEDQFSLYIKRKRWMT